MEQGRDKRLDDLLRSYGAERHRWPEAERGAFADQAGEAWDEARGIDRVLGLANAPAIPAGAEARLMARIGAEAGGTVIGFRRPAARRPSLFRFAAAVPLAASLALGIYLGARGEFDFMLPSALTDTAALTEDAPDDLGGVGEADAYAEENLT